MDRSRQDHLPGVALGPAIAVFRRIPVIGDDIDDVLGVVYLKDLVRRMQHRDGGGRAGGELMRAATFVPESKPVDDLLREMQAARTHIAIVVDEYGGTAGLVTIEDILEEIVGEITRRVRQRAAADRRLPDGSVRVIARLPVEDLAELFDVELPRRESRQWRGCSLRNLAGCRSPARGDRRGPASGRRGHGRPPQPDRHVLVTR